MDSILRKLTRGGSTVSSQGKASEATGARRSFWAVEPLSHIPRWAEWVARRVPTLCVAWVVTQRASGYFAQSVSTHL